MELRCLIVDDSTAFLGAARSLLEQEGIAVVAVASSGDEALRRAAELRPDVVLVDIALAGESGFDLARRLAQELPGDPPTVILISTHPQDEFADLVEASPAVGFVPKSALSARAVLEVLDGPSRSG